jgi:dihydrofolate reductase
MKYMVVAYDNQRVIGGENAIPWQGQMAADMRHFKNLTMGNTVVMGRKTYESIGHALPFRQNIVLTRQDIEFDDAQVVHSLAHAYSAAFNDIYIIGGAEVYQMALDDVDVIYATEIHADFDGSVRFPALPDAWQETSRENHTADERNKYDYSFVKYVKQQ